MNLEQIVKIKLDLSKAKYNTQEFAEIVKEEDDPCEKGYAQLGTKMKDGREVPNCVPIEQDMSKIKEGFPVPSPSADEDEQKYISRCMGEIGSEYEQSQALAICYSKWREK